jgi:hypothetical protein
VHATHPKSKKQNAKNFGFRLPERREVLFNASVNAKLKTMAYAVKIKARILSLEETAEQPGVTKQRRSDILAIVGYRANGSAKAGGRKVRRTKRAVSVTNSDRSTAGPRNKLLPAAKVERNAVFLNVPYDQEVERL